MPLVRILPHRVILMTVLLGGWLSVSPRAWAQGGAADTVTNRERLATEVMRSAMTAASASPLTVEALEIAALLAREAVDLDDDSADLWRLAQEISTLAEDDALRARAIEALGRLDPADERIRLVRLLAALDRYQTVDERVAATEQLISDENVGRIGKPVASRLALDVALLRQRVGDTDGFSRWLARALELDRSNRTAAALAAGFYRANVADAAGEADLLVNLMLADPTDVGTQITLAQLLLEYGAYAGADRIYRLALQGLDSQRESPSTELLADIAVAQWAAGDVNTALKTIDRRQKEIDEVYRLMQAQADRSLTALDLSKISGPVEPTLAAVAAVMLAERRDPGAAAAMQRAIEAYEAAIPNLAKNDVPPAVIASRHLEIAWIAVWLGDDAGKPQQHIDAAEALEPLSETARQRFEGWRALREGDFTRALERLEPLAADDIAARVGVALAMHKSGRIQDAARELLAINRSQPGSMIGIWASGELTRILGQRLPLTDEAAAMERLIASISNSFDRCAREAAATVSLRIEPLNSNPGPFDPVRVRVTLSNTGNLPLAMDREGPLRPQVLVIPELISSIEIEGEIKPFVVDIDSRLRLLPRESVSTEFDLRRYAAGGVLNALAPAGAVIKLTAISNFVATTGGSIVPGLYGLQHVAPLIRVDGARHEPQWLARAISSLELVASNPIVDPRDAVLPAALAINEIRLNTGRRDTSPEIRDLILRSRQPLPEAFARFDAVAQAWLLTVTPNPAPSEQLLVIARQSPSRLVRMAYMLFHLTGPDDPMLEAAFRGDDPAMRRMAQLLSEGGFAEAAAPPPLPATVPDTMPEDAATQPQAPEDPVAPPTGIESLPR